MAFEGTGKGLLKGLAVTIRNFFRLPITTQYPEERLNNSRRLRGYEIIWERENCTGCGTCAKYCPQGNIEIITREKREENRWEVVKFEIDHGRCMFCGLCVEACPFEALYMGRGIEKATYRRDSLFVPKEGLLPSPERRKSGYFRPSVERELPPQTLLIYGERKARR